jgi:type IV secretory pathway VirB10-like protein
MSQVRLGRPDWNPWKFTTIGMGMVLATALVTGVVVANYVGTQRTAPAAFDQAAPDQPANTEPPPPVPGQAVNAVPPPPQVRERAPAAPPPPPVRRARVQPSTADIDACNRYASTATEGRATKTLTDALIGGALGAGLGAAGGAIAGGGSGAGKGAGIGALVGAAGGTVYGLNETNQRDGRAAQAYRACMKRRGYSD